MTKTIYRRLIELVLLFLVCLNLVYQVVDGNVFMVMLAIWSIIIIVFILPFMALTELVTKRFSPVIRALLSLFCHIAAIALGCFALNFLGALIQEYASNQIFPQTVKDFVKLLPYAIGLWGLDEVIRFFFREPSSVIQWKSKSNGA
ncbi:hypothetical protein ACFO25_14210 [Paenactinomyces guangxiensis]|uniref:Uncharacterized protein n=1 Tax=Paenactinomyces guangxiensis TaxID=1490290 RepID=A0A7W1WQ49_9BACL|nr:hypothetical protein [Paenactinomyces guangxiensis]MBA4493980.1 hypothetical protein [Paenactinomyces guangxiensis]MBH8593401.1 hypothetical protein [Paenactinomyces guangxiensis]